MSCQIGGLQAVALLPGADGVGRRDDRSHAMAGAVERVPILQIPGDDLHTEGSKRLDLRRIGGLSDHGADPRPITEASADLRTEETGSSYDEMHGSPSIRE